MKKRKRIIVKRSFQYRLAIGITGLFMVFMTLTFGVLLYTMQTNNAKMTRLLKQQEGLYSFQAEVMKSLQVFQRNKSWENLTLATDKASRDLEKNKKQIDENISLLRAVAWRNSMLLWITGSLMLVMVILTVFWALKRSHRIAGPVYLLERYLDELIDDKYPYVRPLRDGDEFSELFSKFTVAVASLKEKEEKLKARKKKKVNSKKAAGV